MSGLVGRERHAGVLRGAVERAATSHGGLVLVTGEPGIGKSTLVARTADFAVEAGALVLSGACWEGEGAPGYWPWIQVVRALGRLGLPADVSDFELYDAVTTLLVTASRSQPVLVVLEDLHWADPASIRLLEFAVKHAWYERLVVVGTYRDAEVEGAGHPLEALQSQATTLTLTGLDLAGVAALVTETTGVAPDDDLVADIHRRTGGNPFFVEQTARLWQGGSPLATIPPGVRAALRRRLSRLPAAVTDLLATAAVLGREFTTAALLTSHNHHVTAAPPPAEAMHTAQSDTQYAEDRRPDDATPNAQGGRSAAPYPQGGPPDDATPYLQGGRSDDATPYARGGPRDGAAPYAQGGPRDGAAPYRQGGRVLTVGEVEGWVGQAVAARLVGVVGEGRFAFVHDLVRETLYADLAEPDRRARHAAALHALVTASPTERAAHAYQARTPDAPGHLIAAARDAELRLAAEEASGHYRRALELVPEADRRGRAEVMLDLGISQHRAGDLTGSRRTLGQAVEAVRTLDEPELFAHAALRLHNLGGQQPWISFVHEAHSRLLNTGANHDQAGQELNTGANHDQAGQELSAYAADQARAAGNDRELGYSLQTRIGAIWGPGTAAERAAIAEELAEVAHRLQDLDLELNAESWLSSALLELGDARYVDHHRMFVAKAERADIPLFTHEAALRKTLFATLTGRFDEARRCARETFEAGEQPQVDRHGLNWLQRWSIALLQGRLDEVDTILAEMREAGNQTYPLVNAVSSVHRGERGSAVRHLTEVMATGEEAMQWMRPLWLRFQAQAAALSGDPVLCERARQALEPYRGQWALTATFIADGPYDHWIAVLDAAQGRWDDAIAGFIAAQRAADVMGARPWSLEARARLAETLLARDASPGHANHPDPQAARTGGGKTVTAPLVSQAGPSASPPDPLANPAGASASAAGASASPAGASKSPTGTSENPAGPVGASVSQASPSVRSAGAFASQAGVVVSDVGGLVGEVGREAEELGMLVRLPRPGANALRLGDGVWSLAFAGRTAHMPDSKGLRDLHVLLGCPGVDVPAVQLLNPAGGEVVVAARSMGGDAMLDDAAKEAYRRRLALLDDEIDRAAARGDDDKAVALDRERQALLDELRVAAGLGGRSRRLGDEAERARKAVTNRIRDTLRRLDDRHPELAGHLRAAVSTGITCRYQPPTDITWAL